VRCWERRIDGARAGLSGRDGMGKKKKKHEKRKGTHYMQIFFLQYNFFSTQKTVVAYGILPYCARGATLNVHQFIYMSTREVKGK
jgi:hypothetical protein